MSTRARGGQSFKPIIIGLVKTEEGYKLEEPASATTISIPKNLITKTESKPTTVSMKADSNKSVNALAPTSTKKKTQIGKTGAQKITPGTHDPFAAGNSATTNDKGIIIDSTGDSDTKKREIFPFTNFADPIPNPAESKKISAGI